MSLCTASLVNNAEDTDTGRGRGTGGLEELSGDKSKPLCPADGAQIHTFHVISVIGKHRLVVVIRAYLTLKQRLFLRCLGLII